jgi:hypothetical protein
VLQKKNGAGWLKRFPSSGFLERAIKKCYLENIEIWTISGYVRPPNHPFLRPLLPPRLSAQTVFDFAAKESLLWERKPPMAPPWLCKLFQLCFVASVDLAQEKAD